MFRRPRRPSVSRRSPTSTLLGPALLLSALGCLDLRDPLPIPPPAPVVPAGSVEVVTSAVKGENLAAMNLAAMNLAAMNLAAMNLAAMNMGGSNLAAMNMSGSNYSGTNFGGNNLAAMNMAATNLAAMNLAGMNLAAMNLAGLNLGASNLSGSNVAGTNLAAMNLAAMNLAAMNLAGADSGRNLHGLARPMDGMLYSGEDLISPKSDQCIVMGIGSTAFARLLAQQTANAKISVALGKLPWGFSTSAGGPVTLEAWEALVWGDTSYCSFIVTGPPGANWTGVAGFIKAIFRWNAPPTQVMDISGIDASAPYDSSLRTQIATYTGMMNAGGRFMAGTIDELAFMAGELAFITATTNNQSVMVEFSSWVRDTSGNPLILGNVESVNPPTYSESVYFVYQNPDGTVGVSISKVDPVAGINSAYGDLVNSYLAYRSGLGPKPTPIRCGGALFLTADPYLEPVPSGKCDSGLSFTEVDTLGGYPSGMKNWASVPGTTAPMNQGMFMPIGASYPSPYLRSANKPILSETYIFMWEPNHVLPASAIGGVDGGDRSSLGVAAASAPACATGQEAAKAFDQLTTNRWCATGTPSSTYPRTLMYNWGASIAINSYLLTSAADYPSRDPASWTFQGCYGGCAVASDAGWVTLDTRSNQSFASRMQTKTFTFSNTVAYPQYRLRITANKGNVANVHLSEVDLLGSGPVVPLTTVDRTENGTVSWTGNACSQAEQATRAFDNLPTTTRWCVSGTPSASKPISVSYAWATGQVIWFYTLTSASDAAARDPKSWTLQGCSGACLVAADTGWTTLDTRTNETFMGRGQTKMFGFSNNTAYTQYRLRVSANAGDTKVQIGELQLY